MEQTEGRRRREDEGRRGGKREEEGWEESWRQREEKENKDSGVQLSPGQNREKRNDSGR